ncbi:MAG TPA: hypothetical protein VK186_10225 [Candidatus Deferrimicrobium sp.]|nr:hypothetical protein [Candidatus Deferrimicrobium sp.]
MKKTDFGLFWRAAALSLLLFLLCNCTLLKPKFDPVAYQYAVILQKEALALMDKAREPFSQHSDEVYRLMTQVENAYEYSRLQFNNARVTSVWEMLRSPGGNQLGQFMLNWHKEDILPVSYIKDIKESVIESFKVLLELEKGKKK